jgi:O-antigen/teichoic acid export membrane protein
MQRSGTQSILVNAGWLASARVFTLLARLLYIVILAKYLGPTSYGLFVYGQSWYTVFVPFATLGVTEIVVYEIGRDRGQGARYVGHSFCLQSLAALILMVVCAGLGMVTETASQTRSLLLIFSLAVPGRALWLWIEAVFRAYESNRQTFWQEALFRLAEILTGVFILLVDGGILMAAWLHVLLSWLQGLGGVLLVRQRLVSFPLALPWHEFRVLMRRGAPILASVGLFGWLQQGPLVLYRHTTATLEHLGQLSLVMQAFLLSARIFESAVSTVLPVLSRAVARQDEKVADFMTTSLRLGILLSGMLGLLGLSLGQPLILLLFGSKYAHASTLVGIMLCLLIPWTLAILSWQVLLAHGHALGPSLAVLAGAAVMTGTLPVLVPLSNTTGVLLGIGLGIATWFGVLLLLVRRLGMPGLGNALWRATGAVLLALGGFLALHRYHPWLSGPGSVFILFVCAILLHALTPAEYAFLAGRREKFRWPGAPPWRKFCRKEARHE